MLAWARAPDLHAAQGLLAKGVARLTPALLDELRAEVAAVSLEALANLLAAGGEPGAGAHTIAGLRLDEPTAMRVAAWLDDQDSTGRALGLPPERWRAILRDHILAATAEPSAAAPATPGPSPAMNRLLGKETRTAAAAPQGGMTLLELLAKRR